MSYWQNKRAVVTGGSAGLGLSLARVLVERGARVMIVARGQAALDKAATTLRSDGSNVLTAAADMTNQADVDRLASMVQSAWGGLDFLGHCAGRSMRGTALATPVDEFRAMLETNFLSAVRCAQAFAEPLTKSRGHFVLVGSLASKVAAGYLGAYPTSKFPLAAFAQQLRMEHGSSGMHTLLVCPGPIAREEAAEATSRYAHQAADVPAGAHKPGGGAKVRAIDPVWLTERMLRACEERRAELIVPRRARLLFAAAQLSPTFGDWLLRKMMST